MTHRTRDTDIRCRMPFTVALWLTGHETQELTGSEIVSREIDPVPFIHLLATDNFLPQTCNNGTLGNCHIPYAVNN